MSRNVLPFRRRTLQLRSIVVKLIAAGVTPARIASHAAIGENELQHWLNTPGTSLPPKAEAALTTYVKNLRKILTTPQE